MEIKTFFDEATFTLTHVIYDKATGDAVVIDPVLDFDPIAWTLHESSLNKLNEFITQNKLRLHYVVDTHIHADHVTGMQYFKERYGVPLVINAAISKVQSTFRNVFNLPAHFKTDGSQFDKLVSDGDVLRAGTLNLQVTTTPGHTPACTSYRVNDAVFTGDTLFCPDVGTGRCDFPNGSARDLFNSVTRKLYTLPETTRVFPGHDYPGSRTLQVNTTIGESKKRNADLPATRSEEDYVAFMTQRDGRLPLPRLIYQSVQLNINAGVMPDAETNGARYLKIPLKKI
jgi:glyoxylase-like metal-dependent hydrolase (beta-lactamase superfamily II)